MTRAEAAVLGGKALVNKFQSAEERHQHFVSIGEMGGRPRNPTLQERQQEALEAKERRRKCVSPGLRGLKELFKLQYGDLLNE